MKPVFPILLIPTVISCTVPFELQSENFEEVLVINGKLTDSLQVHSVTVSYSRPLDDTNQIRVVEDAQVKIQTNEGGEIEMKYYDGAYHTSDNFKGIPGVSYRLTILMSDGTTYQSNFEELIASPPIDSIYDRYAEISFSDQSENDQGIQFFVDTHDDSDRTLFFRYEYDETWEVRVPYPARYTVNIDSCYNVEFRRYEPDSCIVPRLDTVGLCYEYGHSTGLNIATTINNNKNRLVEHPLTFISQSSQKIRTKYSVLVRQYSISKNAFNYYRKLKENNESSGSLFDRQRGAILGNVLNPDDPQEAVLGYFEVSGYSDARETFSVFEFDRDFRPADFRYSCLDENMMILSADSAIRFLVPYNLDAYQIFGYEVADPELAYLAIIQCTSCAEYADTKTPDYWIEN